MGANISNPTHRTGAGFSISFPAMRGLQANREFFVIMCPLRYLPRLFIFNEEPLPAEMRAQRALNHNRLPSMVQYIIDNRNDYVFSALTASIDGEFNFESLTRGGDAEHRLGVLDIAMDSRFLINDGQHRRAAIEEAMELDPTLMQETIPVVIFCDEGLERSQQMFADLNRHAVRPAKSIGVLYDHRDEISSVLRKFISDSNFYRGIIETEKSSLSPRSGKLFTLSALYNATTLLLSKNHDSPIDELVEITKDFWEIVSEMMHEWQQVANKEVSAGEIRTEYLNTHGIIIHSLGSIGCQLLSETRDRTAWKARLSNLQNIDWRRSNSALWEGRALIAGRVSKSRTNVLLTTTALKELLGFELDSEERKAEIAFKRGKK